MRSGMIDLAKAGQRKSAINQIALEGVRAPRFLFVP
jgi:hypothetical protein